MSYLGFDIKFHKSDNPLTPLETNDKICFVCCKNAELAAIALFQFPFENKFSEIISGCQKPSGQINNKPCGYWWRWIFDWCQYFQRRMEGSSKNFERKKIHHRGTFKLNSF